MEVTWQTGCRNNYNTLKIDFFWSKFYFNNDCSCFLTPVCEYSFRDGLVSAVWFKTLLGLRIYLTQWWSACLRPWLRSPLSLEFSYVSLDFFFPQLDDLLYVSHFSLL